MGRRKKITFDKINKRQYKQLERTVEKSYKDIQVHVVKNIEAIFEENVKKFYDNYTPKQSSRYHWKRSYDLFYSSNAYKKHIGVRNVKRYVTPIRGSAEGFKVGINIGTKNNNKSPYSDKEGNEGNGIDRKSWIFNRSFGFNPSLSYRPLKESIHGFTSYEANKWGEKEKVHTNRFGVSSKWTVSSKYAPNGMEPSIYKGTREMVKSERGNIQEEFILIVSDNAKKYMKSKKLRRRW